MFKKAINFIKKDFLTIRRDNMLLWALLGPITYTLIFTVILGIFEKSDLNLIAVNNIPEKFIEMAENYTDLEFVNSVDELKERIQKADDVAGIYYDQELRLVLEGNETENLQKLYQAIFYQIQSDTPIIDVDSLGNQKTFLREYGTAVVIILTFFIAGILATLVIVEEKESKMINAIYVTPFKFYEYFFTRSFFMLLYSIFANYIVAILLIGTDVQYWHILLLTIISIPLAIIMCFVIAIISYSNLNAIANMKIIGSFYFTIPIASLFTPLKYHFVYYIFPHYWAFNAFKAIFVEKHSVEFGNAALITLVYGIILVWFSVWLAKRKLKI